MKIPIEGAVEKFRKIFPFSQHVYAYWHGGKKDLSFTIVLEGEMGMTFVQDEFEVDSPAYKIFEEIKETIDIEK